MIIYYDSKKTGRVIGYTYFPKDYITGAQIREYVTQNKKCSKCGKTKNSSDFHIQRDNKDGLQAENAGRL